MITFEASSSNSNNASGSKEYKDYKPIFKIIKVNRKSFVDEILSDSNSDSFMSECESHANENKRINPSSKVNFTKLSNAERYKRMQNLSKLVKKLNRKLANIDNKMKENANKLLNRFLKQNFIKFHQQIKQRNYREFPLFNFNLLSSALEVFYQHDSFEFEDEKFLLPNIVTLIAEKKLKPNSLKFKHICSIIRNLLHEENKAEQSPISNAEREYTYKFSQSFNVSTPGIKLEEMFSKFLMCREDCGVGTHQNDPFKSSELNVNSNVVLQSSQNSTNNINVINQYINQYRNDALTDSQGSLMYNNLLNMILLERYRACSNSGNSLFNQK